MKIGLLEDNPAILDYMTTALEMAGHSVVPFTDGPSLVGALLTGLGAGYAPGYDVIIVDLLLPGEMSGLETIRRIQQGIAPYELPFIVVSAGSKEELEQVGESLPGVPVLRKPFKMHDLLRLVEAPRVS